MLFLPLFLVVTGKWFLFSFSQNELSSLTVCSFLFPVSEVQCCSCPNLFLSIVTNPGEVIRKKVENHQAISTSCKKLGMVGLTCNSCVCAGETGGSWIQENWVISRLTLASEWHPVLRESFRVVIFYQNRQWNCLGIWR